MNRVIAGYDGSPHAGSALAWAVEQARRQHAWLHLLTVVDPRAPRVHADDVRAPPRPDIDRITGGLPAEHRVEPGDAAACLVRAYATADHCARHARCPTVIVPAPAAGTGAPPFSSDLPDEVRRWM